MPDFVFKTKGLTTQDRELWEKDNIDILNSMGYQNLDTQSKQAAFKNAQFKNRFGSREDYEELKKMSPELRDSVYISSLAEEEGDLPRIINPIQPKELSPEEQKYNELKNYFTESFNASRANLGNLIGSTKLQWEEFDKMLDEFVPTYKRYKGSEYFPLDDNKKVDLMSTFAADINLYGEKEALDRLYRRVTNEIANNLPLIDKAWNMLAGNGATFAGAVILTVGWIAGTGAAVFGEGLQEGENYFKNILTYGIDNAWTRYGNLVMELGTLFTENDPEKAYNRNEILRTVEELENLVDNIFSINTLFELGQLAGFTEAAMLTGGALVALGNGVFNTARMATLAGKAALTVDLMNKINKRLLSIAKWQRRWNAYGVPSVTGLSEAAINALGTKLKVLEEAENIGGERFQKEVNLEVARRLHEIEVPKDILLNGLTETFLALIEPSIRLLVELELNPIREDVAKKAEENADIAAIVNFTIGSFINGLMNNLLKAPMFGGLVTEAIKRSKVGKLFSSSDYMYDSTGKVVAKLITKKLSLYRALKETWGETIEEYELDVSDAFAVGGAEDNLLNYIDKRYSGISDDAISDDLASNLGAAFAAAGRSAISKDAIQSGIYGGLGLFLGMPNVNTIFNKATYSKESWKNLNFLLKLNSVYRIPFIESYYNDKLENELRRDTAKALNEWLSKEGNKEKLTTLEGSLNWARSIQEADDVGDEYSSRNSRLGKLVLDYFMLEHLEGTPLYDAYMLRYMDILNAKDGDEMAQQIAKYDDRELSEVLHDALKMLDIMLQVREATADIEKSLGNSISLEVKETLVYGKITMSDRLRRLELLELELKESYGGGMETSLTSDLKKYIALNGSMEAPLMYDKPIEDVLTKIANLEKNKEILSDKQKTDLKILHKLLNKLLKEKKKVLDLHNKIAKGIEETLILSEADIMSLSPEERYIMLNPKNLNTYSQELLEVIKQLINKGTATTSDFMNKIEDSARLNTSLTTFLDLYNEALKNPDFLNMMAMHVKTLKKIDNLTKSYQFLNTLTNKSEFTKEFNKIWDEADDLGHRVLNDVLKDNELYKEINKANTDNNAYLKELQNNPKLLELSPRELAYVAATIGYLTENGYSSLEVEALLFLTQDEGLGLKQWIDNYNLQNPNELILYDKVGDIVGAFLKATDILINELKELEKANTVDTRTSNNTTNLAAPIVSQDVEALYNLLLEEDLTNKKENTNKILEAQYGRLSEGLKQFLDLFKEEVLKMSEDGTLSPEFTVSEIAEALRTRTYSTPEAMAIGLEIATLLTNPIALELQRRKEEQKLKDLQKEDKDKGGKAIINLLNYNEFTNETPKAIKDFYEAYEIDLYLRKNEITPNRPIYIAYLKDLSDNNNNSLTLVALVEDEYGPIIIEGHKFLPIGVLPSTFEGVDLLNDKVTDRKKDSIIVNTTLNGRILSTMSPMIDLSKPNVSLKTVANIETSERVKKEAELLGENARRNLASKVINDIIKKIKFVTKTSGRTGVEYSALEYRDKDLKGGEYSVDIFVAQPWDTTNKNGKSLKEILLGGDYREIFTFNSRLRGKVSTLDIDNIGFINALMKYYESHPLGQGLSGDSGELNKVLLKWIKLSGDYTFLIMPAGRVSANGLPIYQLMVSGPKSKIVLTETEKSLITNEKLVEAVRNLFLDESGNFRTTPYKGREESIAKWNVDYTNFDERRTETYNSAAAKTDRINVFNDGLLTISHTRLSRTITQVPINNPINPEAKKTDTTVANKDNANMNPTSPTLDSSTNSNKPKPSQVENNTRDMVNRIIEDSKKVVRGVVNGARQAIGVTRIIKENTQAADPKALAVGNTVDKLVRNIFANRRASDYSNIENGAVDSFVELLDKLKRTELAGYEIISEINYPDGSIDGVRVNGNIIVTSDGLEHKVPITGTLDLLAYNPATGKFRIYDIKTIRDPRNIDNNTESWKKLLYLYKKMLEDKYGITIESVHILPVLVNYHDMLDVLDGKLTLNGQEYKGVEPKLLSTVNLNLNNFTLRIRPEYFSAEDKELLKGEIPNGEPEEVKTEDKPKPPVKGNSGLAAPSLLDSSALDDLGLTSNDVLNGQDNIEATEYPYSSLSDEYKEKLLELFAEPLEDIWDLLPEDLKKDNIECVASLLK